MRHTPRSSANDRATLGLLAGAVIALGGLVLFLSAHALATRWESLGPDVWGGTTDPETVRTYQIIGLVVLVFGLVLLAVAFHRWLITDRTASPKEPVQGTPLPARRRCPQCGTTIRPDAPEGLCPECLLKEAMNSGSDIGQEPEVTGTYSPRPLPPGLEELAKQFPQLEILELLGQGGMGIVYKARQPRLDRFVALKILPAEGGRDPAFAERFAREARALAKLTHPSIVTVYDFGESDGRFYLLMEFVDGVNLRQLLRDRRLTPAEALRIVPQICEALQYAHEQGVVHRDIKPENILLDKRGHVKIADFGLAKLLGPKAADSALTGSQQIMGTPHYMAPEQMERPLAVDHRADIYSLGVVFYEMLTGELPLGRFAPPSQKVQVDVRLDEVVLRTLEKEPERRYQHASDVKAEVETITHPGPQSEPQAASSAHGRPPQDPKAEELERFVLPFLPDQKVAAIKAFRDKTGASLAGAKAAVEAIARKHGLPAAPPSLRDWTSLGGVTLCALGMLASFIPAVTRQFAPNTFRFIDEPSWNQEWITLPDRRLFSWEWMSILATFLVGGLCLLSSHSLRRMAVLRACIMLLAGIVVLVLNQVRAGPVFGLAERNTTPYVGFYLVGAVAVGLLILGAMALRSALMNTSPDADAQAGIPQRSTTTS